MTMEEIRTEIYFGNGRYLMKNWYYVTEHDVGQQRGWRVQLYDVVIGVDSGYEIMDFFSWWYWSFDYGLSEHGENEDFFIRNPHSKAVKELLKILDAGTKYGSQVDDTLKTLYEQVYKSSQGAWSVIMQLVNAIESAQEQRDYVLASLNYPPRYKRNL